MATIVEQPVTTIEACREAAPSAHEEERPIVHPVVAFVLFIALAAGIEATIYVVDHVGRALLGR